jgi:hypothetical protein
MSGGRGARVHASSVENRLLAAGTHATGDQPLQELDVETAQALTAKCDVFARPPALTYLAPGRIQQELASHSTPSP